ncbi:glycosyltransferase family 2 protein [Aquincola tertiaricarbonis]|uniref:glycosyltransferase family 2 protein n=1 Tax=Aquincola tertiaricarbonis TaxID=391953 RepID=UPI000614A4EB|nr:glycosyltransferase [Aquincola tertiaricarbonis]
MQPPSPTVTDAAPPLVSVIVPTYNCAAYIDETVASVLAQTHPAVELIVIDDGSTDGTLERLAAWGPRLTVVPQANAGVCAARNHGLRIARGEFVCLLDHDDYWFPDKLAVQVAALQARPEVGVVYGSFMPWQRPAEGAAFPSPASLDRSASGSGPDPAFSGWIYHQFLLDCWMLTSSAMFRASVFRDCGLFDETLPYSEDWELWLRISRRHPFLKLREVHTLYRQHRQQGNRVVRPVDYRTELLQRTAHRWGLASADGRQVSESAFRQQLARYHVEFGLSHLAGGSRRIGLQSMLKALRACPWRVKPAAYMLAATLGWKPAV